VATRIDKSLDTLAKRRRSGGIKANAAKGFMLWIAVDDRAANNAIEYMIDNSKGLVFFQASWC